MTVYNETFGYAGQLDAMFELEYEGQSHRLIVDYKTSRKDRDSKGNLTSPYDSVALQLAAYRHAEMAAIWRARRHSYYGRRYYLLDDEERAQAVAVPEVDGGLCLWITPERCEAHPIRCDDTVFRSFLYVLEAARWTFETSKTVIGAPLVLGEAA